MLGKVQGQIFDVLSLYLFKQAGLKIKDIPKEDRLNDIRSVEYEDTLSGATKSLKNFEGIKNTQIQEVIDKIKNSKLARMFGNKHRAGTNIPVQREKPVERLRDRLLFLMIDLSWGIRPINLKGEKNESKNGKKASFNA
jgi:hypothetical protein